MTFAAEAEPAPLHGVTFYDDTATLVDEVTRFAADGLLGGEAVLLVVGAERRTHIEAALQLQGLRPEQAAARGDLAFLDADSTIEQVLLGGDPDAARLDAAVGTVVAELARDGRPVRVFGTMVAMLWERGHLAGAIQLEGLWNQVMVERPITLLCAYAVDSFTDAEDLAAAAAICRQHAHVVTPARYPHVGSSDAGAEPERSRTFLPAPPAVAAVRRFVEETVTAWGGDRPAVDDAMLVASELATNALLHAGSPFRVTLARSGGAVRLGVEDASPTLPEQRSPSVELTTGRGISMVNAIAQRWGTEARPGGKVVWAELATPAS
jgi:hypothetical protein